MSDHEDGYFGGTCIFTRDGEAADYFSDNICVSMAPCCAAYNLPMNPPTCQRKVSDMSRQAQTPDFSRAEFRAALGMFATGVTIVTARTTEGRLLGLTANSFNSVSLEPPLVLWSLARAAASLSAFSTGSHYAINILGADQHDLARRFAAKDADRFADVAFTQGVGGAPLLSGAAATFECFNRSRYEEGDHVIFVGEVERCSHRAGVSPLLFHGGKFYTEHPL